MREFSYVAITKPDGSVAIMQVVEKAPLGSFSVEAAQHAGYALVGDQWVRQIDLESEVQKVHPDAVSWREISPEERPGTRMNRDAWTDKNGRIEVDPARIKQRPKSLEERVDELQQEINQLKALGADPADIEKLKAERR